MKKYIILFLTFSIILFVYISNNKKDKLNNAISNLNNSLDIVITYNDINCYHINGCSISNVETVKDKDKLYSSKILISDNFINTFSGNFENNKISSLLLFDNIRLLRNNKEDKTAPTNNGPYSLSIILNMGITDSRSVIQMDMFLFNLSKPELTPDNSILFVEYYGIKDSNLSFLSFKNMPKIQNKKIIFEKSKNILITFLKNFSF